MGDKFDKVIRRNIFVTKVHPALPGFEMNKCIEVKVSIDKLGAIIDRLKKLSFDCPLNCTIYDEENIRNTEDIKYRRRLLESLNGANFLKVKFELSDTTLPVYNYYMEKFRWRHGTVTELRMTVDRNAASEKNLMLEKAQGTIIIPEEKLVWQPDYVLARLRGKVSSQVLDDTDKLKDVIRNYSDMISSGYYFDHLTDFDKVYLAYHYLFDRDKLNIGYAWNQTIIGKDGVMYLKRSPTEWESRPYGTYEYRCGVCEGQARLMAILLNNSDMRVDAVTVDGHISSGTAHTWVEFVIDGKLYQCCTTMRGYFKNLDAAGYKPNAYEIYPRVYEHSYLTDAEIAKVDRHVKTLKKR